MKLRIFLAGLLVFCLALSGCLSSSRKDTEAVFPAGRITPERITGDKTNNFVSGRLLVKLKPGSNPDEVFSVVHGRAERYSVETGWYRINYDTRFTPDSAVALLLAQGQVFLVEVDYTAQACVEPVIPNDPGFADKQWGLKSINAAGGWAYTTGSQAITIAVLDTGIDHEHPDLAGKVVDGYNTFTEYYGKTGDDNGHGTHVAGIAAAETDNEIGMAGVAWDCRLMPVKVLDDWGEGSYSQIAEGIFWAVENGADVINMSLGGWVYSRFLHDAVEFALENDVVVVAAAGNDSKLNNSYYPAAYPGVISVGAITGNEVKAKFSTEGDHLFLGAPGRTIYSTIPGNSYAYYQGTSMAAPFVSGAAALIKSRWPEFDLNAIHSQLKQTAREPSGSSGWNWQTGWGILNLEAALAEPQPNQFGTLIVNVVYGSTGEPLSYAKILVKETNLSMLTDENGRAFIPARPEGSYTVYAEKGGFTNLGAASVTSGSTAEVTIPIDTPPPPDPLLYTEFIEDAESDDPLFAGEGSWDKTTESYQSAAHSWTDSPGGEYGNNWNYSLVSVPVSLAGSENPHLSFWHKYEIEDYFDHGYVELSDDNGISWTFLASYTGEEPENYEWHQETISLYEYKDEENLRIRFRLETDYSVTYDGWYLDDITIIEL